MYSQGLRAGGAGRHRRKIEDRESGSSRPHITPRAIFCVPNAPYVKHRFGTGYRHGRVDRMKVPPSAQPRARTIPTTWSPLCPRWSACMRSCPLRLHRTRSATTRRQRRADRQGPGADIRYLITEAETLVCIWDGPVVVQGHGVGLDRRPASVWCRRSTRHQYCDRLVEGLDVDDRIVVGGAGGAPIARGRIGRKPGICRLLGIRSRRSLFTFPAHPNWAHGVDFGPGRTDRHRLAADQSASATQNEHLNMTGDRSVAPVLATCAVGRINKPVRPWLVSIRSRDRESDRDRRHRARRGRRRAAELKTGDVVRGRRRRCDDRSAVSSRETRKSRKRLRSGAPAEMYADTGNIRDRGVVRRVCRVPVDRCIGRRHSRAG